VKLIDLNDPLRRVLEVYAVYWVADPNVTGRGQRIHLVIPYEGYDSFMTVPEESGEIVDPTIDGFILRKSGNGWDMLVHWAAEKGDLLDMLIDGRNPDAIAELHRRIREDSPRKL